MLRLKQKLNSSFTNYPARIYSLLGSLQIENVMSASVYAVDRIDGPNKPPLFKAIAIFDDVPTDDSVSSYIYEFIIVRGEGDKLKITSARKSWRCWADRGHQDFSVELCS